MPAYLLFLDGSHLTEVAQVKSGSQTNRLTLATALPILKWLVSGPGKRVTVWDDPEQFRELWLEPDAVAFPTLWVRLTSDVYVWPAAHVNLTGTETAAPFAKRTPGPTRTMLPGGSGSAKAGADAATMPPVASASAIPVLVFTVIVMRSICGLRFHSNTVFWSREQTAWYNHERDKPRLMIA